MKKIILFCLVFVNIAYGYNYNNLLLKAQASIFPKIILLDKKLDNKLIDGKIIYTIVYDESDYDTAVEVSAFIDKKHKGYFDNYIYKINLVKISDLSKETEATVIYALNSISSIIRIADIAKEKGIITFSYSIENLRRGLLFSLIIEKSTVLYLNKENLYAKEIDFVDSLLQMVKFID